MRSRGLSMFDRGVKLQEALARFRLDEPATDDGNTIVAIFVISYFRVFAIDPIPAQFASRRASKRRS
jgi:hypothetical protein